MSQRAALALRGLDQIDLAGRAGELGLLDAALERVLRRRVPQRVLVSGAAGIGKSRLCQAWCQRLRARQTGVGEGVRVVEVPAPAGDDTTGASGRAPAVDAFDVVAAMLRRRLGLEGLDAGAAQIQLRDQVHRVFADRRVSEVSALLGSLIGFEMPPSPLTGTLARPARRGQAARAQARRDDLTLSLARAVLVRFLERDALAAPLVIVLEDLHRADERSLDTLQALFAALGEGALLIVATARPELLVRRPGWGTQGGQAVAEGGVRLDLGPLARPEIEALMKAMLSDGDLVADFVDRAAAESGGNPALLEQVLRVYRQHGILTLEPRQGWMIDLERVRREAMAVTPAEAAEKRLATLSDAERELLARGSVFGEAFWTGAVVALGRLEVEPKETARRVAKEGASEGASDDIRVFTPDPAISEIQQLLGGLRERGYLQPPVPSSIAGEIEWRFQYPAELAQLATTACRDPELTRRRKGFAAQWLESHLAGAGVAAGTAQAEVDRAREAHFAQLGRLYEEGGDRRRGAYCLLSAGALARTRLPLDHAHALYLRAISLLDADDAVAKIDALHTAGDLAARLGRTREAIGHFQELLRLAWRLDLPAKGGAAHDRLGRLHGLLGEHGAALGHLTLARELFELAGDLRGIASTLDDIGRIQFLAGAPDDSLEHHRAALAARERLGDDRGRALTLARLGQVEHETGALAPAGLHFREALELRRKIGDRQGEVCSLLDLGSLERDLGRADRALELLDEGRALARQIGDRLLEGSLGVEIGNCYLTLGQAPAALAELALARQIARTFGARHLVSEATRGIAEAELSLGRSVEARNEARAAYDIAERIGSPPLAGAALWVAATSVGRGAPGDSELGGAREMFDRAVQILGDAGAELELGRALSAYADFEERTGRVDAASELRRQNTLIVERARRPGRTRQSQEMAVIAFDGPA